MGIPGTPRRQDEIKSLIVLSWTVTLVATAIIWTQNEQQGIKIRSIQNELYTLDTGTDTKLKIINDNVVGLTGFMTYLLSNMTQQMQIQQKLLDYMLEQNLDLYKQLNEARWNATFWKNSYDNLLATVNFTGEVT